MWGDEHKWKENEPHQDIGVFVCFGTIHPGKVFSLFGFLRPFYLNCREMNLTQQKCKTSHPELPPISTAIARTSCFCPVFHTACWNFFRRACWAVAWAALPHHIPQSPPHASQGVWLVDEGGIRGGPQRGGGGHRSRGGVPHAGGWGQGRGGKAGPRPGGWQGSEWRRG